MVGHVAPSWRLILVMALRPASPFDGRHRLRLGRTLAALTLAAAHRAAPEPPVRTILVPGRHPLVGLQAAIAWAGGGRA